jgi:preprotein translocase subunit SecA
MADLLKQRRYADEVMGLLWQEEAKRFAGSARNAPCPCGSGRKFKHCHGKEE